MIKILPTENFTITTHLRPDRVEDKLLHYVEPYQLGRINFPFSSPPDKPYEGRVQNGCFQIQKISRNNNRDTLPIVEGKIFSEDTGSFIEVTIKPNEAYNLVMLLIALLYISITIFMGVNILFSSNNDARGIPIFVLFFPLWMGMVYFFVIKKFKSQMKKDKKFLYEIFEYSNPK